MPGPRPRTTGPSGSRSGETSAALKPDGSADSDSVLSFSPQVDLGKTKRLTGIITQGAKDFGVVQFVSEFKVVFSHDGTVWSPVKNEDGAKDKV